MPQPTRPSYEALLQEEESILAKLNDRIVQTGSLDSGVPIERDRDPKLTTALRERLQAVRNEKKKLKDSLDPVEATVYTLYEKFLKQRSNGE